ncbi:MAG: PilZ domain-containing protein [Sphingomicrobium sp.]
MRDEFIPDGTHAGATAESRADVRTNLFVAAILRTPGTAQQVRIRDLSPLGAKVDGATVAVGSTVTLVRGQLSVAGLVVWSEANRCGLQFQSSVVVREWMAPSVNREQQRVDQIVAVVRAGAVPLAVPAQRTIETPDTLAEDIIRVATLLGQLGDELATDLVVAATYPVKLQYLDIAVQTLNALAETVRAEGPDQPSNSARLSDLRNSCTEALRVRP